MSLTLHLFGGSILLSGWAVPAALLAVAGLLGRAVRDAESA